MKWLLTLTLLGLIATSSCETLSGSAETLEPSLMEGPTKTLTTLHDSYVSVDPALGPVETQLYLQESAGLLLAVENERPLLATSILSLSDRVTGRTLIYLQSDVVKHPFVVTEETKFVEDYRRTVGLAVTESKPSK